MSARDKYHDVVRNALIADGWRVTHDPFRLKWGVTDLYTDIGAESLLAAEKETRQIIVEIKGFLGKSPMNDLQQALGQYNLYQIILAKTEPGRQLFLAVPEDVFDNVFEEAVGKLAFETFGLKILTFDPIRQEVHRWIS